MTYRLFQIKSESGDRKAMFLSYELATGRTRVINPRNYNQVVYGKVGNPGDTAAFCLEVLYSYYNNPTVRRSFRSMSVSDVVILDETTVWYCDSVGFRELTGAEKRAWLDARWGEDG